MKPCTLITCVYVTEDKACKSKLQFELCSHIIDVHQWRRSFILLTAFVSAAFSQQTTAYVTWATTTNPAGLWCKHISRVAYHHQNKPALMGGEQGVSVGDSYTHILWRTRSEQVLNVGCRWGLFWPETRTLGSACCWSLSKRSQPGSC